jgi:HTH-type transcriptional regulator / antitoxin HigA
VSNQILHTYAPHYAVPPGESVLEALEDIGMTQTELARRTERSVKNINQIIKGKAPITPGMAVHLERVLGVEAGFWSNLEANYRVDLARMEIVESLAVHQEWLKRLPLRHMAQRGWIDLVSDKAQQVLELLKYFGVVSVDAWNDLWGDVEKQFAFSKSTAYTSDLGAVAAWLRQGQLMAQSIELQDYNQAAFRRALLEIRSLTAEAPEIFVPRMIKLCAECGVAVVFVKELPKARTWGASYWRGDKAVIQLSLYGKKEDRLWFSFFHEAGHILSQGRKTTVFLDTDNGEGDSDEEKQANTFSANTLIPPDRYALFVATKPRSKEQIRQFAATECISPAIVVGRLQHDGILAFNHCNDLKRTFEWIENSSSHAA